MKCDEARRSLEDLHDGELGGPAAASLSAHVSCCQECAEVLQELERESQVYRSYAAALDRQAEEAPGLWPGIRSAVASDRSATAAPPWRSRFIAGVRGSAFGRQLAYSVLLVAVSVGATLFVVRQRDSIGTQGGMPASAGVSLQSGGTVGEAMRSFHHAEQQYVDAFRTLSGIVDRHKPALPGELLAEVERNLRQIDESIAATRKAYYEHPADPELAHYMLTAYSRKVELLQELASIQVPPPKT